MRRGVEVHRMIELHALGQIPLWDVADNMYDAVDTDEAGLGQTDATGSRQPFDSFMSSRFANVRARFVEAPIDLQLEKGRIRGRIDAVYEPTPGEWEIVDWKSGTPSDDPTRVIQLQAYAVAAMEGLIGDQIPHTLRVTFCYLGGGQVVETSHEVTPEWLVTARQDLESALAAASGPEFPQRPGSRCHGCDFTRFCEAGQAWLSEQVPLAPAT